MTPSSGPVRPDDRADRQVPGAELVTQPTSAGGFDWVNAGLGAVGALGLVVVLAGVSIVALRRRATAALQ